MLLHSAGIAPGPGDTGNGGGGGAPAWPHDDPGDSGGGMAAPAFVSSDDFAERAPELALASSAERAAWRSAVETVMADLQQIHQGDGRSIVSGLLEARHANSAEEPNLATLHSIGPGLVLADQVALAEDEGLFNRDLFADALGVASWAIAVDVGTQPDAPRLGLLPDARIAFVVGVLSPVYA